MKYDVVASIGYNCEISFRLENFYEHINAMPFSWSYVLDRDSFPMVLKNIEPLFAGEVRLLDDNMIMCENTNIKFHPRYEILLKEGTVTEETRVAHLKKKFQELLASDKKTLFLLKVENKGEESNVQFIHNVLEALKENYRSGNFTLAAFVEQEAATAAIRQLESEQVKIRVLKRFAPRKHTDIAGDVKGWYRILKELTGDAGQGYWKRLWKVRRKWFFAVLKKKLLKK